MDSVLPTLKEWLDLGAYAMLIVFGVGILYAGNKGYWVFGYHYKREIEDSEKLTKTIEEMTKALKALTKEIRDRR